MITNYLRIFARFVRKTRVYFFLNVAGLAIAICSVILLYSYISFEFSFDRFHKNASNIYRMTNDSRFGGQELHEATTNPPLGNAMETEFPEVIASVRLHDPNLFDPAIFVRYEDKAFKEDNILYADSTFFKVFSFPMIEGVADKALSRPATVVLTESMRQKYFGSQSAVGQTVFINNVAYEVTGVCADPPANTHIRFDFLAAMSSFRMHNIDTWLNTMLYTYVLLEPGTNAKALEAKLGLLVKRRASGDIEKYWHTTYDKLHGDGGRFAYGMQPITDIHLKSHLITELGVNGDYNSMIILSVVAVFILVIACFNFINLTTALSSRRAREVGMKKVFGTHRYQLVFQFVGESIIVSFIALCLALALTALSLPLFNGLTQQQFLFVDLVNSSTIVVMILFAVVLGGVAGLLPALYVTEYQPIEVLKGNMRLGAGSGTLRNGLVVVQMTISILLIASSLIFSDQIKYMTNLDLGYDKEHSIVLHNVNKANVKPEILKNEMLTIAGITSASVSTVVPSTEFQTIALRPEGTDREIPSAYFFADYDFVKTLKLEIVQGRDFSRDFPTDTLGAVLVNETFLKEYQLKDPLGKSIMTSSNKPIVGVIKDFHLESLKYDIKPLAIIFQKRGNFMTLNVSSANFHETIARAENKWKDLTHNVPFQFSFLSDHVALQYQNEVSLFNLTIAFTSLSIFISCLGLMGLITFSIRNREKEISIRKVLGSGVASIQFIFAKEMLVLIAISAAIAIPVAWYMLNQWLEGFNYHVEVNSLTFATAVVAVVVISMGSIFYFTLRAAFVNPVKHLRSE